MIDEDETLDVDYIFHGDETGIVSICDMDPGMFNMLELTCRLNNHRKCFWGTISLTPSVSTAMKALITTENGKFGALKLVLRSPFNLPKGCKESFHRNMNEIITQRDHDKFIDEYVPII